MSDFAAALSSSSAAAPAAEIDDVTLATLVSSRICHDVISPVGALNNGIEIIAGGADPSFRDHAERLIATSAGQAKARLEFFRGAFGQGGALGEEVRLGALSELLGAYLDGGRTSMHWETLDDAVTRPQSKLFLNLMLVGCDTLPRGDMLHMGVTRGDGMPNGGLAVIAEGPVLKLTERTQSLLESGALPAGEPGPDSKEAVALFAHRLARRMGATLTAAKQDDHIILAAIL